MALIPFRINREPSLSRSWDSTFNSFQKDMNRLMDSFFSDLPESWNESTRNYLPTLDVTESENAFHVHVDLPGLDVNDVELSFNKNTLQIKGEKKFEHQDNKGNVHRVERSYGSFLRSIPFQTEIDQEKIEASFDKGVLRIALPKAATALKDSKKIQIKS